MTDHPTEVLPRHGRRHRAPQPRVDWARHIPMLKYAAAVLGVVLAGMVVFAVGTHAGTAPQNSNAVKQLPPLGVVTPEPAATIPSPTTTLETVQPAPPLDYDTPAVAPPMVTTPPPPPPRVVIIQPAPLPPQVVTLEPQEPPVTVDTAPPQPVKRHRDRQQPTPHQPDHNPDVPLTQEQEPPQPLIDLGELIP